MSRTLVIASRELRERSRIFLMAAAMAVLQFLSALVPAASNDRSSVIAGVGGFIGIALAFGVAIAMGTSSVSGELAARRMSFYFSKPISPAAIWFGKLLAAVVTSASCFAIVAGPAFLVTGSQWQRMFGGPRLLLLAGLSMVAMFLFAHTLSTMVRSRSGLIGLDFALAVITGFALYYILRPMLFASVEHTKTLFQIVAAAFFAILFAAPVWQLAKGRTDVRRSHAALSRAIWTSVAVVVAILAAYTAWIVNVGPSDLRSYGLMQQAPGGNSLFLSGTSRGDLYTTFLIDVNSGRHERVPSLGWWGAEFSQDGKTIAWLEPVWRGFGFAGAEIYTKRLDQPGAKAQATGVQTGRDFALSPDGSRLAVLNDSTISVHDVATQRLVASVRRDAPPANAMALFFLNNDVVRFYRWPRSNQKLEIFELDARTKSIVQTGEIAPEGLIKGMRMNADGSRVILPRNGLVADARTGAVLAKLPIISLGPAQSAILSDGTIALAARDGNGPATVHVFAPDGTPQRDIRLPVRFVMISGETDGNKLIAVGSDKVSDDRTGRGRKAFVIDIHRGTIERTLNDIRGPIPNYSDARLTHYRADEKLVAVNGEGELVTWNAMTGEVRLMGR
jgi:ABC-type transport system involved in multi-copper enzyme maturation permease subunit